MEGARPATTTPPTSPLCARSAAPASAQQQQGRQRQQCHRLHNGCQAGGTQQQLHPGGPAAQRQQRTYPTPWLSPQPLLPTPHCQLLHRFTPWGHPLGAVAAAVGAGQGEWPGAGRCRVRIRAAALPPEGPGPTCPPTATAAASERPGSTQPGVRGGGGAEGEGGQPWCHGVGRCAGGAGWAVLRSQVPSRARPPGSIRGTRPYPAPAASIPRLTALRLPSHRPLHAPPP
ncbi:hypothetical protein V8C86DRAFT_2634142 [Haematococcus lacustris]